MKDGPGMSGEKLSLCFRRPLRSRCWSVVMVRFPGLGGPCPKRTLALVSFWRIHMFTAWQNPESNNLSGVTLPCFAHSGLAVAMNILMSKFVYDNGIGTTMALNTLYLRSTNCCCSSLSSAPAPA